MNTNISDMEKILIGTYNMSFAGDAALDPRRPEVFESEGAFHLSNPEIDTDLRANWKRALNRLKEFLENKNAVFIGLQEINKTKCGKGTGSDAIEKMLGEINDKEGWKFDIRTEKGPNPPYPGISIVWNTSLLGDETQHSIVDLNYTPTEKPGIGAQAGRPMLMVLTQKNYLLVSLHAPNHPALSELTLKDLHEAIQTHIKNFIGNKKIDPSKIFIAGDFNDRYDALQKIVLSDGTELHYKGDAPKSCCHNWDSSCTEDRFQPKTTLIGREARTNIGTCDAQGRKLAGPGPREVMGVEGNIENYRYYGDKVFGAKPAGDIRIFPPGRAGASKESDHEMVVAEYINPDYSFSKINTSLFEGGRRRTRRVKRRAGAKARRTHRHIQKKRRTHRRAAKKAGKRKATRRH